MLIFKPWYSERVMSATIIMWIFASFALDLIPGVVIDQKNQLFLATFCIYLFLFIACTIINRYLYLIRPPTDTTKFNFYLNLGGLLGTILGALLIPVIGRTIAVQHLEMVSSVLLFAVFFLLRDSQKLRNHFRSRTVLKISLLSVIIFIGTYYFIKTKPSQGVYIRTLYNVMRIQDEGGVRSLVNGGVTHGKQFLDETRKKMPTLYYHPRAPFANIMNVMPHGKRNVAIIGLGIGAMAYYSRPEDQWTFFEIDGDMELIARNYFSYLSDSKANLQVVIGDGRIKLKERPQLFDLLVIDAFSGDAVPAHLLTEESIGIYLQKLKSQKGPIVFHISNSFVNIESVLIPTAIKMGFTYASSDRTFTDQLGQSTSHWLILSHDAGIVKKLIDEHGWIKKPLTKYMNGWTDDYISFFQPMFLK